MWRTREERWKNILYKSPWSCRNIVSLTLNWNRVHAIVKNLCFILWQQWANLFKKFSGFSYNLSSTLKRA